MAASLGARVCRGEREAGAVCAGGSRREGAPLECSRPTTTLTQGLYAEEQGNGARLAAVGRATEGGAGGRECPFLLKGKKKRSCADASTVHCVLPCCDAVCFLLLPPTMDWLQSRLQNASASAAAAADAAATRAKEVASAARAAADAAATRAAAASRDLASASTDAATKLGERAAAATADARAVAARAADAASRLEARATEKLAAARAPGGGLDAVGKRLAALDVGALGGGAARALAGALAGGTLPPDAAPPTEADLVAVAIDADFKAWAKTLSYASFCDGQSDGAPATPDAAAPPPPPLTPWQSRHALLIVQAAPEVDELRYVLVPKRLTERAFWARYFSLARARLPAVAFDADAPAPVAEVAAPSSSNTAAAFGARLSALAAGVVGGGSSAAATLPEEAAPAPPPPAHQELGDDFDKYLEELGADDAGSGGGGGGARGADGGGDAAGGDGGAGDDDDDDLDLEDYMNDLEAEDEAREEEGEAEAGAEAGAAEEKEEAPTDV